MTKQTYGNKDYISFAYDSLDRLSEKSYNKEDGSSVAKKQYIYGNDGNISVTVDFASNSYTRYNYDLSGRTASIREYSGTDVSSNIPISYTEYKYADKTNYLTNVKHFSPIGTQNIAYKYGNVNNGEMPDQVYSVSWNGVEKVTNKFDSLSRLSKRTVNGLATNYTYKDLEGNQTTTLVKSIETVGITHTYEYDSLGNITSIYDGSKTTTYKYDALNQLVRADNPYENKTHIYTYENGNITEDKVYQYTVGTSEPSDLKYTVKYSYSNEKWADVLTGVEKVYPQNSVNTISLEQEETPEIVTRLLGENAQRYDMKSRLLPNSGISVGGNYSKVESDEIGNITKYNDSIYTWIGRQLQSVSNEDYTSTFSYNSDGQRIGKSIVFKGASTYNYEYYYNGDILAGYKLVITKSDGSSTTHNVAFMYDENGEAFGFNYNGNDYYYVRNAQNDVIFISNSDNTGVVMYQYDAWGNITACYDTSDDGMLSIVNPYTYRGYFYEIETNTYFLKSRYYNPELCRFISADGYVQTGQGLLDKNMFAYCGNNPVNRVDETGYGWRDIWNGIKSFLSSIFGWSSSIETTSNENCVPFLPEPLPVTLEMTEKQTVTKPKSGDSSKPITAFLKTNTKHPIKSSTVGIKVNIAKLSFTTDLGLDNFGSSVSCTIGDTTYGFRKRGDITRLKIGYEFSAETQIGEDVKDGVYTNVSLSGWFLLMAYAYATTGSPAPSSQYSYAN